MENPNNKRSELRISMSRRATLHYNGNTVPCLIEDFSSAGFFIVCTKKLVVGQVLELKCELYPDRHLQCKIEIRHINDTCLGTKIVEISEAGKSLCAQFLEEHYSENLGKFDSR
jgi:hypothetical protein